MNPDLTLPCGDGYCNIRVGALLVRDGTFLLAGNSRNDYLYTVGGRVRFGETAEEAILREVLEETGTRLEIDRLGFVHEGFYNSDSPIRPGAPVYEICFYFYMKLPEDFSPIAESVTEDNEKEFLVWVTPEDPRMIYPEFLRTELLHPHDGVKHIVTDDRISNNPLGG